MRAGMRPSSRPQRGAALIVVLMLLLVVTLLGLASMRDAIMQERMAAYTLARGYAFQAAEAAMREAEDFARGKPEPPADGCSNGVCANPYDPADPTWQDYAYNTDAFWQTAANYKSAGQAVNGITPRYSLTRYGDGSSDGGGEDECLGENCGATAVAGGAPRVYRIIVRSRAANGTEVMLQSLYQAP